MRPALVLLHRWTGLATALFLVVAGLTGTVLAYKQQLEALISPRLFVNQQRPGRLMDPFVLRETVQRQFPQARVDYMPFPKPGQTAMFYLSERRDPQTGAAQALTVDQVFANPYTGAILGSRKWGALFDGGKFRPENIVPFIWKVHEALALPFPYGKVFMGFIALCWTIDCFVGFALTLPRGRPFLKKWKPAWLLKRKAAQYRRNLDLHRAFGLWLWVPLLMLAWSSVMFNLRDIVYRPVMSIVMPFDQPATVRASGGSLEPTLDWRTARKVGNVALMRLSRADGFAVRGEDSLWYRPRFGAYMYRVKTSLDIDQENARSDIWIDGNSGKILRIDFQRRGASGDVVSEWLRALHSATTLGPLYRIFIALLGIVVALLSLTGIVVWWKKRAPRVARKDSARPARHVLKSPQSTAAE